MIDKMSDQNRPEYFGLPANIEQSAERTFSSHVISRLRLLLRSTEAIQKYDREGWQAELSPILNLWKKLNQVMQAPLILLIVVQKMLFNFISTL